MKALLQLFCELDGFLRGSDMQHSHVCSLCAGQLFRDQI
jgi:hypothetical protein